jgi:hypothetical protein
MREREQAKLINRATIALTFIMGHYLQQHEAVNDRKIIASDHLLSIGEHLFT